MSEHISKGAALDTNVAATAHAITPLRVYLGVFAALLALTGVTVGLSYADIGPGALYLALFVALIKAGLVVGYFMHLKQDARFHQLIFFRSGAVLVFMFAFTFIDLVSRPAIVAEQGTLVLGQEREQVAFEAELRQRLSAAKAAAQPTASPGPSAAAPAATPTSAALATAPVSDASPSPEAGATAPRPGGADAGTPAARSR
ncbi:MAG: cytochrome C oxidase subunit IV family protein [Proteobacteria bacterium]|nr:cytochrome C oxidase subunit IV family protein [Pseudomonadota bacterium]